MDLSAVSTMFIEPPVLSMIRLCNTEIPSHELKLVPYAGPNRDHEESVKESFTSNPGSLEVVPYPLRATAGNGKETRNSHVATK